jgi:hypothetical protein
MRNIIAAFNKSGALNKKAAVLTAVSVVLTAAATLAKMF